MADEISITVKAKKIVVWNYTTRKCSRITQNELTTKTKFDGIDPYIACVRTLLASVSASNCCAYSISDEAVNLIKNAAKSKKAVYSKKATKKK